MSRSWKRHLRVLDDAMLEFANRLAEICADTKPDRSDNIEWSGDTATREWWDILFRASNVAHSAGIYEDWLAAFHRINERRIKALEE